MIKYKIKTNTGFIALMSAIIISVVLLLVVTNLGFTEFYNRSNILDSELKEKSFALAEACVDTAILKLANDSSYNPINEPISVDADNCIIQSVASGASQKIISIQTNYKNYYTNLKIVLNSANMSVVSWEEIPN